METRTKIALSLLIASIMCLGSVASFAIVSVGGSANVKNDLKGMSQDVSRSLAVESLGSVSIPEDSEYTIPVSDLYDEGWDSMSFSGNSEIWVDYDSECIYFVPLQDWFGVESIDITAYYNTSITPPPMPEPNPNFIPVPTTSLDYTITYNLLLEVLPVNDPPVQIQSLPCLDAQLGATVPEFANLSQYFRDIDSDLDFFANTNMSFVTPHIDGSMLSVEIGKQTGRNGQITIFATDGEFVLLGHIDANIEASSSVAFPEDNTHIQLLDGLFSTYMTSITCVDSGPLDVGVARNAAGFWTATIKAPWNWNGEGTITLEGLQFSGFWPRLDEFSSTNEDSISSAPGFWTKYYVTMETTVEAVNDPPTLVPWLSVPLSTDEDTTLYNALDATDLFYDVDSELTYAVVSETGLTAPSLDQANLLSAVPMPDESGTDIIQVIASDGEFSAVAGLTVDVLSVNDLPFPEFDGTLVEIAEDTQATLNLSAMFGDIDSELTFSADGTSNCIVAIDQANATATIRPVQNWFGNEAITFRANDGLATASSAAYLAVSPVNDPVSLVSAVPAMSFDEDGTGTVDLSTHFADIDSQIAFSASIACPGLTVSVSNGVLSIASDENWNGDGAVSVVATDGQYSATSIVDVSVLAVNDPPVALSEIGDITVAEDGRATIELSELFADVDSTLEYIVVGASAMTASVDAIGTLTISAPENWYGSESLTVTATDGETEISESAQVTFTPVNDAPVLVSRIVAASFVNGEQRTLDLRGCFLDPDGDALSFALTTPDGISAYIDQASGVGLLAATANYSGTEELVVTATDGYETTSTSMDVVVTAPQTASAQGGLPVETAYMLGGGMMVMSALAAVGLSMYAREAGLNRPARRRAKQTIVASA
ncbi:MAG: tandem-95 repeat protein [Methanobacteriota archaeon]